MSLTPFEPTGPRDRRLALHAEGVLRSLNDAGWIEAADVHVAARVAGLVAETDDRAVVALALTVRAAREGSACLDPSTVLPVLAASSSEDNAPDHQFADLLPTDVDDWLATIRSSALAAAEVLQVEHDLIYLDRYHREEVQVADTLRARGELPDLPVDDAVLEAGLARVFAGDSWHEQRDAVRAAAGRRTTVLVGGPGTGKTSTVAGLLTLLVEQAEATGRRRPTIALAAPTGKAAARLQESVAESVAGFADPADRERVGPLDAVTVHRLLGWRPGSSTRFRRDRANPLPHDVIVVDEASMLSLTLTARLLDAVRPGARLVLVGDPDQLASVEAGAVLADLVAGYQDPAPHQPPPAAPPNHSPVVRLRTSHRFGQRIGALAAAVRDGQEERVVELLRSAGTDDGDEGLDGGQDVAFVEVDSPGAAEEALRGHLLGHASRLRELALREDAEGALRELSAHRLLCAHRDGPWGVSSWNDRVHRWLAETTGYHGRQYAGRPLLVTANDHRLGLYNGDTGVVVLGDEGRLVAVFGDPTDPARYGIGSIGDAETAHAMTIHKSQGSQARHVTVLLPDADSRLLTRELLYTAITRAQHHVTVVGSEESVRAAVTHRTARASGLRHRL